MMAAMGTAIVCKFTSIVFLYLALDQYQNLSSNSSNFTAALFTSLVQGCLLAPLFTHDYERCMPKNFLLPQEVT